MKTLITVLAMGILTACSGGTRGYNTGYSDGFTIGYNTACNIRLVRISGHFDSLAYGSGYEMGLMRGEAECLLGKQALNN